MWTAQVQAARDGTRNVDLFMFAQPWNGSPLVDTLDEGNIGVHKLEMAVCSVAVKWRVSYGARLKGNAEAATFSGDGISWRKASSNEEASSALHGRPPSERLA